LEREDGGRGRKKKEERRDAKEMHWCFIFSYDFRRDSGRDVPDNLKSCFNHCTLNIKRVKLLETLALLHTLTWCNLTEAGYI
jgi:hypothetical protein